MMGGSNPTSTGGRMAARETPAPGSENGARRVDDIRFREFIMRSSSVGRVMATH